MSMFGTDAMSSHRDAGAAINQVVQEWYPGATVANMDKDSNLHLIDKNGGRFIADPKIFDAKVPWYGTLTKALVLSGMAAATGGALLGAVAPGSLGSAASLFTPATYGAGSVATGAGLAGGAGSAALAGGAGADALGSSTAFTAGLPPLVTPDVLATGAAAGSGFGGGAVLGAAGLGAGFGGGGFSSLPDLPTENINITANTPRSPAPLGAVPTEALSNMEEPNQAQSPADNDIWSRLMSSPQLKNLLVSAGLNGIGGGFGGGSNPTNQQPPNPGLPQGSLGQPQYSPMGFNAPNLFNFDRPGQGNMYGNASSLGGMSQGSGLQKLIQGLKF